MNKDNYLEILPNLVYGNLDQESRQALIPDNQFTNLTDKYTNFPYPNITETREEIKDLIILQDTYTSNRKWDSYKQFMETVDESIDTVYERELQKLGIEYEAKYFHPIQDELGALVMRLKKHYNRPRPYQVAFYLGIEEFSNFNTFSGNTPAYPSGHATQSYFTSLVLAFHNPEHSENVMRIAKRIAKAREVMGVHYESDSHFGQTIAESLARHKDIKDIYFNEKKVRHEQ